MRVTVYLQRHDSTAPPLSCSATFAARAVAAVPHLLTLNENGSVLKLRTPLGWMAVKKLVHAVEKRGEQLHAWNSYMSDGNLDLCYPEAMRWSIGSKHPGLEI
jgi:hypothetical protein